MTDPRLERAVEAAVAAHPPLDRQIAHDTIAQAATSGRERNLLARWLERHEDGLSSGSAEAPLVVGRVVDALRVLGVEGLSKPRCATCGREKKLPYVVVDGRECTTCYRRGTAQPCSRCGRVQPVSTRDDAGAVCDLCLRSDPARHAECRSCGEIRPVVTRRDGGPLCPRCYVRPTDRCADCGLDRPIHSRRLGRPVCDRCYEQPTSRCARCGQTGPLALREAAPGAARGTCKACYRPPPAECVCCGATRRTASITKDGPLCARCAPRPTAQCSVCRRDRPVHRRLPSPVCTSCYDRVHRIPCTQCGLECRPYERGCCSRCVLRRRVDHLLADTAATSLHALRTALIEVDEPRSTLRWLTKSEGAALVSDLAAGRVELSHETLSRSKPGDHLRGLLMATAVLEDRDVHQDRLEPWLDGVLAAVDHRHVAPVRAFAVWHVFRRARYQARRGRFTENSAKWARLRVRQAAALLAWLDDHDIALENITQADIELWLATGSTTRYVARDFLIWARRRRLAPRVDIPLRRTIAPTASTDDDDRWHLVDRLLTDDSCDIAIRVAGLFALLFGQHLSRVASIERAAVTTASDGTTAVQFSRDRVTMPPLVDALVRQLLADTGHAAVQTDRWLFPGGTPGRHVSTEQLRKRLATEGITLRPARQAALMHLAAEMPAPVLADLIGMHVNTATTWVRNARGDWSAYAASGPHHQP